MEEYHQFFQSIQMVARGGPTFKFLDLDWEAAQSGAIFKDAK